MDCFSAAMSTKADVDSGMHAATSANPVASYCHVTEAWSFLSDAASVVYRDDEQWKTALVGLGS